MMTSFTIIFLVVAIIAIKMAVIVPTRSAYVVEHLGRFRQVWGPGIHWLIPVIDRVAYRHEIREQLIDVPPQSCITRDNIQIDVDGIIYIKVMDARKASYGIENYARAAVNLAQTTLRSELGKLNLHQSFSERDSLNHTVVGEIDKAAQPWGIKVLRYEIMNITPSEHVIHTLEKQMEAERTRRSDVTAATAQKEARSIISEGQRQEVINISEGERQKRINESEGKAKEIAILAEATAFGIARVAEAINKPGGDEAVRMRVVEQFIGELGKVWQTSKVSVVPAELANVKGFFEGLTQVSTPLANPSSHSVSTGANSRTV